MTVLLIIGTIMCATVAVYFLLRKKANTIARAATEAQATVDELSKESVVLKHKLLMCDPGGAPPLCYGRDLSQVSTHLTGVVNLATARVPDIAALERGYAVSMNMIRCIEAERDIMVRVIERNVRPRETV